MSETEKDHKIPNKESNLQTLAKTLLTKLTLLSTTIRTHLSKTLNTLTDAITTRINHRNELKQIEREAYKEELTELTAKRHDRAIELAKERGKQKAHGKKHKPKLTHEQLKTIETRRKQLGMVGRNLSSLVGNTSIQPKKKVRTKEDLKVEIEQVKLEHELTDLKKKLKPKTKGIQVGINPSLFGGGQSNALDNVMSLMGVQKKNKKK
jgi:gas vesicle protein